MIAHQTLDVLDRIGIASPCNANWNSMQGDDRSRFCGQCNKHVYNLSAMTRQEALDLVEQTEGKICARFARRIDGTVLTTDCPVGAERAKRGRIRRLAAFAISGLAFVGGIRLFASGPVQALASDGSNQIGQQIDYWIDWTLIKLRLRQPQFMGAVCRYPISPPPIIDVDPADSPLDPAQDPVDSE